MSKQKHEAFQHNRFNEIKKRIYKNVYLTHQNRADIRFHKQDFQVREFLSLHRCTRLLVAVVLHSANTCIYPKCKITVLS